MSQLLQARKRLAGQMPDPSIALAGSLMSRMIPCNKPGCRFCERGKGKGHGPIWILSASAGNQRVRQIPVPGQNATGMPATVRPVDLVQKGGSIFQAPAYSNGTAIPGFGGLPSLDRIGGGVASGAGPVVIQLDEPATTALLRCEAVQAIASNPRIVAAASMRAAKSNADRRELTSLQLRPGTLMS